MNILLIELPDSRQRCILQQTSVGLLNQKLVKLNNISKLVQLRWARMYYSSTLNSLTWRPLLSRLELPSELNPGPLAALVAPNEADSKTTALLGSRPITGDVLPVVRDQKSQQPAEQDSSQEARQSLEAATGTQLTHTRRNEYPTRDADWMRRAPLPIIPFSGKTPDGGSAASLNSVGTPSTDGKIYTKW
ncbi:hypothetical protein BJ165DRAFT_324875 [Panaeolus papilionaceus]|nr:hypothetical protein BJ165DRAFT_324875 [Panaeolus papilionaceus]